MEDTNPAIKYGIPAMIHDNWSDTETAIYTRFSYLVHTFLPIVWHTYTIFT